MGYIGVTTHLLAIDPNFLGHPSTVDGLFEIRRSPVEVGSLSHYFQGFIDVRWFSRRISNKPLTV